MSRSGFNEGAKLEEDRPDLEQPPPGAELEHDDEEDDDDEEEPSFFADPKRLAQTGLFVVLIIIGIYFLFPAVVGIEDGLEKLGEGNPYWIALAVFLSLGMFASYVGQFRGVVGERVKLRWSESYQITMAGLAATRLFSAGGAGGIVLTYWALRKAGMPRKESAARMIAFLVSLYAVYMVTLVVNGILLRTGVFNGPNPPGLTIVPAAIAGGIIIVFLLMALVPGDLEKRFSSASQEKLWGRVLRRLATVPSTAAVGTREAMTLIREPRRGALVIAGAIGFWGFQIAILWAAFNAFDADVPIAVIVQGFFVGMIANLIPLPGGVGGVDAGMIGAFALFHLGIGGATIFAAVLTYRLIAFWLPLPPGIVAFFQLRRTVQRWEDEECSPAQRARAASMGQAQPITS